MITNINAVTVSRNEITIQTNKSDKKDKLNLNEEKKKSSVNNDDRNQKHFHNLKTKPNETEVNRLKLTGRSKGYTEHVKIDEIVSINFENQTSHKKNQLTVSTIENNIETSFIEGGKIPKDRVKNKNVAMKKHTKEQPEKNFHTSNHSFASSSYNYLLFVFLFFLILVIFSTLIFIFIFLRLDIISN